MSDPISFPSASPRHGLPLLFAGQAQKEFFVNEAHARTDMLLHPSVSGTADTPPEGAVSGACWLVGTAPTGAWAGHAGELACLQGSNWLFAEPRTGMTVYDEAAGRTVRYANGWISAEPVAAPTGGSTVDTEARAAIAGLVAALVAGGLLPAP
jgi:hypothetical protein